MFVKQGRLEYQFPTYQSEGAKRKEYLDIMLQGAKECKLPIDYIEKYIAKVEVSDKR